MATGKRAGNKGRISWSTAVFVVLAAGAAGWWFYGDSIAGNAAAATGYGAKNACSCRYIAGRELGDCRDDFLPGMGLIMLSEDEDAKSVTASVPLIHSQTASFRDGFGCVLQDIHG